MGDLPDPKMEVRKRTIFLAIFCWDIPANIGLQLGLIYGRYLQFGFLKWPLIKYIYICVYTGICAKEDGFARTETQPKKQTQSG